MGVLDPNNKIITTATARNKKVAEQEASRAALELLEPSLNEVFNATNVPSPKLSGVKEDNKAITVKEETVAKENKIVRGRPKVKIMDN
jgi:hypothetical protein